MSLLAITLEMILYTTLHRAMGLNLSGVVDFYCFGINAMKEALITFRTDIQDVLFDCFLAGFEKIYIKSIWAKGFPILHHIGKFPDLIF